MGGLSLVADANILIAFLQGEKTLDMEILIDAVRYGVVVVPPIVIAEMLSYIHLEAAHKSRLAEFTMLPVMNGYWERAGLLRADLIRKNYKPKLPDTLIVQSCLDHNMPLLTRDAGFRIFAEHCGLKLQSAA